MGSQISIADILALPAAERLEIAEAIWDSLAGVPDAIPVPDWHKTILQDRLAEDLADDTPPQGWDDARRKIEKRP